MADAAVAPIADNTILSNPASLQQWSNLIESLFGKNQQTDTSSQGTTTNSSAADNPLMLMITQLMGQMGQGVGSPQIQALLGPIFEQLKNVAMPGIQGLANAGGGVYNSTTQKLLANDALAKATAQGGGLVVQQQNQLQQQLASLLAILARSTQQTQTANNQTARTSTGGTAGNLGKAALGTGAAAAAAKAIKNMMSGGNSAAREAGRNANDKAEDDAMENGALGLASNGRSDAQDDTSQQDNSVGDFYAFPDNPGADPFGIGGYDGGSGPGDFSWLEGIFDGSSNNDFGSGFAEGSGDAGSGFGLGEGGTDIFSDEGE